MKTIILTLLNATLLLASAAVVIEKKENSQTHRNAGITATVEASIAKKKILREKKTHLREKRIQVIDDTLKEKAKIREGEA